MLGLTSQQDTYSYCSTAMYALGPRDKQSFASSNACVSMICWQREALQDAALKPPEKWKSRESPGCASATSCLMWWRMLLPVGQALGSEESSSSTVMSSSLKPKRFVKRYCRRANLVLDYRLTQTIRTQEWVFQRAGRAGAQGAGHVCSTP